MKKQRPSHKVSIETIPLSEIPTSLLKNATVTKSNKSVQSRRAGPGETGKGQKRVKVLIIDDDSAVANTSSGVLDLFGYECFAVYNSADAIASAESFQPDVVLSDVVMQDMNGVELCMELKQMLPDCRIVLLSGEVATAQTLMQDAGNQGYHFDLIAKPALPQELLAKFKNLFGGAYSPAMMPPKAHRSGSAAAL
jgi:CheY-like chemotaxis protein